MKKYSWIIVPTSRIVDLPDWGAGVLNGLNILTYNYNDRPLKQGMRSRALERNGIFSKGETEMVEFIFNETIDNGEEYLGHAPVTRELIHNLERDLAKTIKEIW